MTLFGGAELLTDPLTVDPHASSLTNRLNWLRAGVLGANDGIVSTAGLAGLVAGAVSMALGEYVSVSTQRDSQRALLQEEPAGLEFVIDANALSNPWQAALSSGVAFTLGAIIPLIAILAPPADVRVPVAFMSVLVALVLTGVVSAGLGGARKGRAVIRVVLGGALAMLVTYGIGQSVGTTI